MQAVAARYAPAPSKSTGNPFDLSAFAPELADVEVWPDCWPAFRLFCDIDNQWRRGGLEGRALALDYGVLFARMDQLGYRGEAHEQMFRDVQLMEREALDQMEKARDD